MDKFKPQEFPEMDENNNDRPEDSLDGLDSSLDGLDSLDNSLDDGLDRLNDRLNNFSGKGRLENDKVNQLLQELATNLSKLYAKSNHIKVIIKDIENEGYKIDIFMAYITRLMENKVEEAGERSGYLLNSYDQTFLETIGIKYSKDDYTEYSEKGDEDGSEW